MTKHKEINWAKVRAERAAGTPVTVLAKNYGVSGAAIYLHTKDVRAEVPAIVKPGAKPSRGGTAIGDCLAQLRADREQLNELIAGLEKFEARA